MEEIGTCSFKGATLKGKFVFPEVMTNICEYTFFGCNELTSVAVPLTLKEISECSFEILLVYLWYSLVIQFLVTISILDIKDVIMKVYSKI